MLVRISPVSLEERLGYVKGVLSVGLITSQTLKADLATLLGLVHPGLVLNEDLGGL